MNLTDLRFRLPLGALMLCVVALLTYYSDNQSLQILITLLVCAVTVTALWEYVQITKSKNIENPFWMLALVGVLYIFSNYLSVLNIKFSLLLSLVVTAFFFAIFLYHFSKAEGALVRIATTFFGAIYIIMPLGLMLKILYPYTMICHFQDGRVWFAYLILVTKGVDIGAYFVGKAWGRSKLAPQISPKKTLKGAIGGFCVAILLSFCFFLLSEYVLSSSFSLNLLQSLILGGIIGVFSQLGDLAESLLKRDARIKDSNQIPGFGGALDLVDSLLFTSPIVYLFLKTL